MLIKIIEDFIMNMEQYKLNLFHLILREMEEKVDFNKCWLKIPSLREMVAFKKLHKFSDDEKKAFVYSFVLIKGVYDLCSIKVLNTKNKGQDSTLILILICLLNLMRKGRNI